MKRGFPWWHAIGMPLLFAVLTVALTWPLAARLTDAMPSLGDSLTDTWEFAWIVHAALTDIRSIWNGNVFYPYPNSVAFGNPFIPQAMLAAPILLTVGNVVLAHNVQTLLAFFLTGIATYALAYHYTGSRLGSLVAGIAFSFSSYHFAHHHQLGMGALQWPVLTMLAFERVIVRPTVGRALLLGLLMAVTALANWYYGYMLLPLLAVYLAGRLGLDWPGWAGMRRLVTSLGIAALLTLVLVGPVALPYAWVRGELGFQRSLQNVAYWSANLSDYLLPHWDSWLYRPLYELGQRVFGERDGEHVLFPGFLPLGFAAIGLIARTKGITWRDRWQLRLPLLLIGGVAFLLSLGPLLQTPIVRFISPSGVIPLPYALLMEILPGLDAIRVTARFGVFVALPIALLAAFGVRAAEEWVAQRAIDVRPGMRRVGLVQSALAVLVVGATVLEVFTPTVRMEPVAGTAAEAPAIYRWLATTEPDAAIIELPMVDPASQYERYLPIYMHYSTVHWRRIVNGQMTFYPPGYFDIVDEMGRFPSEAGVRLLQALGVDYVVVHTDRLSPADRDRWTSTGWAPPGLERVAAFDGDYAYRVLPAADAEGSAQQPVQARAFPADHFLAPERFVEGEPAPAVIEIANPGPGYYVGQPADRVSLTACWTRPDGGIERVTLDALAPFVVPPESARTVGARIVSREMVTACAAGEPGRIGATLLAAPPTVFTATTGEGWWELETAERVPTRWMGQEATLIVTSPQPGGRLLFLGEAFARDRDIELLVNGRSVGTFRVSTQHTAYTVELPLETGENLVTFRAAEPAQSPRELGISPDERALSINVQRLLITAPAP